MLVARAASPVHIAHRAPEGGDRECGAGRGEAPLEHLVEAPGEEPVAGWSPVQPVVEAAQRAGVRLSGGGRQGGGVELADCQPYAVLR